MSSFLLSIALAVTAPVKAEDKTVAPDIEGKWLIVYVEEGGKRNSSWEQQVATAKGNALTYSKDGDDRSLKLVYGPGQTVKATGSGGKGGKDTELSGVYIAGQDYFCLSLNHADAKAPADGKKSSSEFIIILRKQR